MRQPVRIRRARAADALRIRNLHVRSIRVLCRPDYTARQIAAWSGRRTPAGYRRAMTGGERMYVATIGGRPVAFGAVLDAEVRAVYVDPRWAGRGVGTRMLARLERDAAARGKRRLILNATLTAVDFYRRHGWRRVRPHTIRFGAVPIPCVRMTKRVSPP
jgi:GNAT superfamily N-acetyltransferase